jgi:predicted transcriptional regulator
MIRKPRDTYHERGPTYHAARRLYLKYPLLPASDIARILGVSRQAIDEYVRDLKPEREERHAAALASIKRGEGL